MNKAVLLNNMQGFKSTIPRIKSVSFSVGKIEIALFDGRTLFIPLNNFPSIKKLPLAKRKEFAIINNGTALNIFACDEIFHIRDFLGLPENWSDL
jgi:hypothetical protein